MPGLVQDPSAYPPPPIPANCRKGQVGYVRVRVVGYDLEVLGGDHAHEGVVKGSVIVVPIDKRGVQIEGEPMVFLPPSVIEGALVVREMKENGDDNGNGGGGGTGTGQAAS